jgi:hypothetical protein
MRKEAPTDEDLASYEGRYPKDLFNKSVVASDQTIGRVAKETDDVIVVFGDSNNSRYDVPKSKIALAGGSVIVNDSIEQYAVDRDAPLPEGKSLRPSAAKIREIAGTVEEEPAKRDVDERSDVEIKAEQVADEVKDSVGGELKRAGRSVSRAMRQLGDVIADPDLEPVEGAADSVKRAAKAGARATKERISAAQSMAEAGLSAEAALKVERESKRRSTDDVDLGSYEGKYPKDLFKKTVMVNGQIVGHVAKETDDLIVVFSEDDSSTRFDIPKSEITLSGNSVLANEDLLFRYRTRRNAPMPRDKSMRPTADQIRQAAARQKQEQAGKPTTPDRIMQEGQQLSVAPRPVTTSVSRPSTYVDDEAEIVKKMKRAAKELKDIIVAGSKVAKKKAKEAKEQAEAKQAEMDSQAIAKMGDLSGRFANSFEDVLSEIRTRNYGQQEQIYTGFLKLMDYQRDLVLARRDLATRLKSSVSNPVVSMDDINRPPRRRLKSPPQLPDKTGEEKPKRNTRTSSVA